MKEDEAVTFTYQFGHPFEHELFDTAEPEAVYVLHPDGTKSDLKNGLKKTIADSVEGKKVTGYSLKPSHCYGDPRSRRRNQNRLIQRFGGLVRLALHRGLRVLHGIIPPVVTPFLADESLDLSRLKSHIDDQLAAGVHGIFVLGTTGEFYALSEGEKQAVTAAAVEHVGGRAKVYVGTGAETTGEVARLSRMAAKEGAAGVSVITPYFLKPTQAELLDHFHRVADAAGVPVILYNNPATCAGLSIEPDTVVKLAEHPHIVGIKDSSGDLQNTIELVRRAQSDTFSVLLGRDTLILAGLMFGTRGAIPATCNIAPKLCVGIYEAFKNGDVDAARRFQDQLSPVRLALSLGTGNGAVKEALALLGKACGPNRRPIGPLSDDKRATLRGVLSVAGLL